MYFFFSLFLLPLSLSHPPPPLRLTYLAFLPLPAALSPLCSPYVGVLALLKGLHGGIPARCTPRFCMTHAPGWPVYSPAYLGFSLCSLFIVLRRLHYQRGGVGRWAMSSIFLSSLWWWSIVLSIVLSVDQDSEAQRGCNHMNAQSWTMGGKTYPWNYISGFVI